VRMSDESWSDIASRTRDELEKHTGSLNGVCNTLREDVKKSFSKLREMLDVREAELAKMIDEAEKAEKERVVDKRKERIDACCESLEAKTKEMQEMLAQGKFDRMQETTQMIKENEMEIKQLAKTVSELTFSMDAQVAIHQVEARIPQVNITSADGAPGIFFTGTGSASVPTPSPAREQMYDAGSSLAPQSPMPGSLNRSAISLGTPSGMSPVSAAPSAIYINGLPNNASEQDIRDELGTFGEIEMINSRHIATGGFAFVFYTNNEGASKALEHPKIVIKGKQVNVLAKKQIVANTPS